MREQNFQITTAESCTGGLIAGALTEIAGSSDVVHGGFVTYANEAKTEMLGVPEDILLTHGAVSEPTARAMAEGAHSKTNVAISIAVTGIAGPSGGSAEKPVGLVYISCAAPNQTYCQKHMFGDLGRKGIRQATIIAALKLVLDALQAN